jgi:hypothetical protein
MAFLYLDFGPAKITPGSILLIWCGNTLVEGGISGGYIRSLSRNAPVRAVPQPLMPGYDTS